MDFENYLLEQLSLHPSVMPQDVMKLCYQAAFGAGHLLGDLERAKAYLEKEYDTVTEKDMPLYEMISERYCRISLAAWKFHKLPMEWLFRMLADQSAEENRESLFFAYLQTAENVLKQASAKVSVAEWKEYCAAYQKNGLVPVHHSQQYREAEEPSYRVIDRKYIRLLSLLQEISEVLRRKERCVAAIDGRAASGKTTMANLLKGVLAADVIRMDDFFLPMELRTAERFQTAGANVHYERFCEEVLPYLSEAEPFSYRIFDCSRMDYHGRCEIGTAAVRIVEGCYSCHPAFGAYADKIVFSDVDAEEQMQRILKRNGREMAEMFRQRWIPLEEAYYAQYDIPAKADIRIS